MPRCEKRRAACSWCAAKTLTAKLPLAWILGQVSEPFAGQKRTSGGCSETDVNELLDMPTGSPSSKAVITGR